MSSEECQCLSNDCNSCNNSINELEWRWDGTAKCPGIHVLSEGRSVMFHMGYSTGTAAARGDLLMKYNHHYFWEIRMYTRLYGTDIMVGIATPNFALDQSSYRFASLLGSDSESWGFSYTGKIQHAGESWQYSNGFELGDVIGLHLDTWNGTLAFYKNGIPLGIAFRGLRSHSAFYPVISSSAAQISMGLVKAVSIPASLFTLCCRVMARYPHLVEWLMNVPGLKQICQHKWLFQLTNKCITYEDDEDIMISLYRGTGLFRTVPGLASNLKMKSNHQRKLNGRESGTRFSGLMDRAVTRNGLWGEFVEESSLSPVLAHNSQSDTSDNNDIYSDLMSNDEEDISTLAKEDMFQVKEERIKFTNTFNSPMCEICKIKPAVSIRPCLKKCLQCLYLK